MPTFQDHHSPASRGMIKCLFPFLVQPFVQNLETELVAVEIPHLNPARSFSFRVVRGSPLYSVSEPTPLRYLPCDPCALAQDMGGFLSLLLHQLLGTHPLHLSLGTGIFQAPFSRFNPFQFLIYRPRVKPCRIPLSPVPFL
jgi:hypothetical protein